MVQLVVPVPVVPVVPVFASSVVLLSVVPVLEVVFDVGAQADIHPATNITKNNFFIALKIFQVEG